MACGESAGPGSLTILGAFQLATVNGVPVPVEVFGAGGSVRITGGTLRLNADGTYAFAIAARVNSGTGPRWEVDQGAGTATSRGNTVRFSDSGDGEGSFEGTVSGNQLTLVDGGITLVFVRGVVVDVVTVTPAQVGLTACVPLQLGAAALNTDSGPVPNPNIAWQSSNEAVATVDGTGHVTPAGTGTASIFATAGSGVDSAVVTVAFAAPSPVTLQPIVWEGLFPRLNWTLTDSASFCYYRVVRDANHGGIPTTTSDSIADRTLTTFLDDGVLALHGLTIDYQVVVHNGPAFAASVPVRTEYGLSIPLVPYPDPAYRPVVSPTQDLLYIQGGIPNSSGLNDTLKALSTASHTVLGERFIGFNSPFVVTPDGAAVLVVSYFAMFQEDSLFTLDPSTLAKVAVVKLPFARPATGAFVAGRPGRVYVEQQDFNNGVESITVIDVATGGAVGSTVLSTDAGLLSARMQMAVSPDQNTLYLLEGNHLWRIDVTTDTATVLDSSVIAFEVQTMQLSPDGTRLYLAHAAPAPSYVQIWNTATWTAGSQLTTPGYFAFYATNTDILVSQSSGGRPGDLYFLSGDVVRYSATTLAVVESYGFVKVAQWIVVARDGTKFYTDGPAALKTLVVPFN